MLQMFRDETYGKRNRIVALVLAVIVAVVPLVIWAMTGNVLFVYLGGVAMALLVLSLLGVRFFSSGHGWKTGVGGFHALPPGFADKMDEDPDERRKR